MPTSSFISPYMGAPRWPPNPQWWRGAPRRSRGAPRDRVAPEWPPSAPLDRVRILSWEAVDDRSRLPDDGLHHLGRAGQVADEPHAVPRPHRVIVAGLSGRGGVVDVLSDGALEHRRQDGRAGGGVFAAIRVRERPRPHTGERVGERRRVRLALEEALLVELGGGGLASRDEPGSQQHPGRAESQRGDEPAPV